MMTVYVCQNADSLVYWIQDIQLSLKGRAQHHI